MEAEGQLEAKGLQVEAERQVEAEGRQAERPALQVESQP